MPETGYRIAFMYVATNRVCLIPEDQPEGFLDLAEIFLGIHPHQRTRWAILFARISWTRRAVRIKRSMLAKVALNSDHVVGFGDWIRRRSIDIENVLDPRQKIG